MMARLIRATAAWLVAMGLGATAQAGEWPEDPRCLADMGYYGDYEPPECSPDAYYSGYQHVSERVANVCNCPANDPGCPVVDVDLHYLDAYNSDPRWAPALILHGGGGRDHAKDAHGHAVSVTGYNLVYSGFLEIHPYLPTGIPGSGSTPWSDAAAAARAVECVAERTVGTKPGVPGCSTAGKLPCLSSFIVNRIAWGPASKENLVVVGHSAGGVAALYLPTYLGTTVKAIIMLDPAKQEYTVMPPMLMMANKPGIVVHLYPDFYGPLQNSANQLFRLGGTNTCVGGGQCIGGPNHGATCYAMSTICGTGPTAGFCTDGMGCSSAADCPGGSCTGPAPTDGAWVPIGIRDYPGCNPDQGCHESTHCSALTTGVAYSQETLSEPTRSTHHAWCAGDVGCGKTNNSAGVNYCPPGKYCSPQTFCNRNPNFNGGATWKNHRWKDVNNPDVYPTTYTASATRIFARYKKVYAACMGGIRGASAQSWVNGYSRQMNDYGEGDEGYCTAMDGTYNPTCEIYSGGLNANPCIQAGCRFNLGYDMGKVIRINNGEVASRDSAAGYESTSGRYYTAAEGWNATTGSFVERQERLSSTPGTPNYIGCTSGPGVMP